MSIARWPGLLPGWYRGVGSVNGFADTFENIGAIDPPNLAEEGLDRRSIDAAFHAPLFKVTENTRATLTTNTTSTGWTLFDPTGANPIRYTTNFDLAADEVALVQYRILFTSQTTGVGAARFGINRQTTFRTRIAWAEPVGPTNIGGYARRSNTANMGQAHGPMDSFLVIPGPVTVDFVRIEYVLFDTVTDSPFFYADSGVSVGRTMMIGTKYRRVQ